MDPGLDFAQALLDQLRRDLKRFAPGRLGELARTLGRNPGYLWQLKAQRLKLHDAFAIMRFIGFTPAEYLARWDGIHERIPKTIPGFFRRHRLKTSDHVTLTHLAGFLDWAYGLVVDVSAPERLLDLPVRIDSLGIDAEPDEALSYADFLFSMLVKHRPETLHPTSAAGLIHTLLSLTDSLPRDRGHQRAAANLVDLGFHLEGFLDDLELRHQLYLAGACVSDRLGYPYDGMWCARQASYLALLIPDFELAQRCRQMMASIAESHDLSGREWLDPRGDRLAQLISVQAAGRQDQQNVLAALISDRDTSPMEARELDRRLGGQRAFVDARGRRGVMKVSRWKMLVDILKVTPLSALDRASALNPIPPRIGSLFQGLKVEGEHRPLCGFQRDLLRWSGDVSIDARATRLDSLPDAFFKAHQEPFLRDALQGFGRFCQQLPDVLHPDDLDTLCEGLLRSSYSLRRQSYLDDSADFLTAAFHLLDRADNPPRLAVGYRQGAYLAFDLGSLPPAAALLQRSKSIELSCGTVENLVLTLFISGFITSMSGQYLDASRIFEACLISVQSKQSSLAEWIVHLAIATTSLRSGDLNQAARSIKHTDRAFSSDSRIDTAEYLRVKATILSHQGATAEPLDLLNEASSLLNKDLDARDLAIIGLERCDHYLRNDQADKARREAKSLLPLASRLKRNPIGQQAIQELARCGLIGSIDAVAVAETRERLLHPNLSADQRL